MSQLKTLYWILSVNFLYLIIIFISVIALELIFHWGKTIILKYNVQVYWGRTDNEKLNLPLINGISDLLKHSFSPVSSFITTIIKALNAEHQDYLYHAIIILLSIYKELWNLKGIFPCIISLNHLLSSSWILNIDLNCEI